MEEKDAAVEAVEARHRALRDFCTENSKTLTVLRHLVEQFNEARKIVADRIYAISKESRKPVSAGPFKTEVKGGKTVNFDALEEIVDEDEFREVVDIKYSFRGAKGAPGKEALLKLEGKYGDALKGIHIETTPTVSVKGPKEVSLGVLEEMG